ncbi:MULTISPECIES: MASE1 domain-containing protein [Cyanophyceae]|uniref:MASE1 domain-containing protein n=1 Tax=Cyanophyceae TaxID=3028117 RepID=UPI00016DC428|nr:MULTISPECIES: MASE1 domain-containing protein [Cyanophyceae]ACA98871.1 two-component hybrid sensor and regulator [Picosynechococcus sp. PCC 7002]SMH37575.1 Signal transduction histidine kinase [Picosynechococcus sp. OG1]SMQ77887.1 Signal transduction histidine kinase [Synechococcus sp. 7002]
MFHFPQPPLKLSRRFILIILLALAYYGTAEISRQVASTPQSVTPIWPPDGIALAATFIYGYQVLPGVFLGSFLANIWAFFHGGNLNQVLTSIVQVLAIALGTTSGMGLGKYLLDTKIQRKNPLKKLDDLCKFLLFIGILTPAINATAGVFALAIGNTVTWANFGESWLTWWISNVSGIYIFTPALISWYELFQPQTLNRLVQKAIFTFNKHSKKPAKLAWKLLLETRFVEALSLLTIILLISYISFSQDLHLEYMLIPCLVWAVIRFGQFGATNLISLVTMLAALGTVRGLGSFASEDINESLLRLQLFTVVIVVTNLSLMATLREKKEAFNNLRQSKLHLQEKSSQLEQSKIILKENAFLLEQQNLELIEAKQAAENANRTKTRFLSSMSHELRTPLNAILGLVELLKDSDNLDEYERGDLQTISDSGIHLLHLIEDILDISRIEAGRVELHFQEVDFPKFLQGIKGIIQAQINTDAIEFICEFPPKLPAVVSIDEKKLKQVLLNLLHNAAKFTEKGQIIFRLKLHSFPDLSETYTLLNFEVEDSGIGIEPDKLNLIFLPFEQTGKAKFKTQGTGLGLAISQEIVRMMGGKISVTSQPGIGSKFEFMICTQIVNKPSDSLEKKQNPLFVFDRELATKLPLKILLAEDNLTNQKVVAKILKNLGYQVDIVSNGLEVLEAVEQQIYDVILMDIQMPEMDGLDATKALLKLNLEPHPYVIALTANAMQHDRLACLEVGMDDYITKPVRLDLLVQALWRSQCCRLVF